MFHRHRTIVALAVGMLAAGAAARTADAQDAAALRGSEAPPHALWLDSLDLSQVEQGWGQPGAGKSVDKRPITLHGTTFTHGLGTHAESTLRIELKQAATRFVSMVGVDDEVGQKGLVGFEVWVDGRKKADSGLMRGGDEPKRLAVDLVGAKELVLTVVAGGDGIDFCHADWAGALLFAAPDASAKPAAAAAPQQPRPDVVLEHSPQPAIHGPRITGCTPGRPLVFLIPATGEGPLSFSATESAGRASRWTPRRASSPASLKAAGNDHDRIDGGERPRQEQPHVDHRRRPTQAGAHAALGLELLELLGQRRERRQRPRRGRRHGPQRPGRPWLPVRQHRRLLGRPARRQGRDPDQRRSSPT
jgi:hypothetical protein